MTSERISLYFKQGSSDKVYTASLEEIETDRFVVNFAYGRRRATLTTGTKTNTAVDYDSAKKIYEKLVKSKTSKGYVPGAESPQYAHTDADMRDTGIHCQLLNFIEEAEAERRIRDDGWWAQEKYDGKRMLLHKADAVTAINRNGLSVGAPDAIMTQAGSVDHSYVVDGEAVGETLCVFDLLELDQADLRSAPYSQRLSRLKELLIDHADAWNESELTEYFIGPVLSLVNFNTKQFNIFSNRTIAGTVGDYELSGEPDAVIASGHYSPKIPYFCFHEYKRAFEPKKDPAGQALAAMLVARELNRHRHPIYGMYVIAEKWHFMVLNGSEYCISKSFAADDEEILDIFKILKALKLLLIDIAKQDA